MPRPWDTDSHTCHSGKLEETRIKQFLARQLPGPLTSAPPDLEDMAACASTAGFEDHFSVQWARKKCPDCAKVPRADEGPRKRCGGAECANPIHRQPQKRAAERGSSTALMMAMPQHYKEPSWGSQ